MVTAEIKEIENRKTTKKKSMKQKAISLKIIKLTNSSKIDKEKRH